MCSDLDNFSTSQLVIIICPAKICDCTEIKIL